MKLQRLCPIKINLCLHIVQQLPNGYHQLQTLFALLNWGDTLSIEAKPFAQKHSGHNYSISIQGMDDINPQDNLIYKAIDAFIIEAGFSNIAVHAYINKVVPMGTGVGGGSSDAATALLIMNEIYNHPLSKQQLMHIAGKLGADVPVFIFEQHAWAESIGEELEAFNLPELSVLLAFPQEHVNTAAAFGNPDLKRDNGLLEKPDQNNWQKYTHNHFEEVIRQMFPKIDHCFNILAPYGQPQLSGTGSCVFLFSEDHSYIENAYNTLRQKNSNIEFIITKTL